MGKIIKKILLSSPAFQDLKSLQTADDELVDLSLALWLIKEKLVKQVRKILRLFPPYAELDRLKESMDNLWYPPLAHLLIEAEMNGAQDIPSMIPAPKSYIA